MRVWKTINPEDFLIGIYLSGVDISTFLDKFAVSFSARRIHRLTSYAVQRFNADQHWLGNTLSMTPVYTLKLRFDLASVFFFFLEKKSELEFLILSSVCLNCFVLLKIIPLAGHVSCTKIINSLAPNMLSFASFEIQLTKTLKVPISVRLKSVHLNSNSVIGYYC